MTEAHRHALVPEHSEFRGRDVAIDVLRRGQLRTFTVKPFERPAKQSAA